MKQLFFAVMLIFASVYHAGAQELVVEELKNDGVIYVSCGSPTVGVLVFKTPIKEAEVTLIPSNKVFNSYYDEKDKEYVLCVEPTSRKYRVTISHAEYETVEFTVEEVMANQPQLRRVYPKQGGGISVGAAEFIELGDSRFKNNQFAEAETYYRNALAFPDMANNAPLLAKLGETCLKQDKNAEAADYLRKAVSIRPTNEKSHYMLGGIYFAQGQYENAANSFKQAVELAPNNSAYRNDLQKALNASPQKAKANADTGDSFLMQGDYKSALTYYNEAVKADPQNSVYQSRVKVAETRIKQEQHMTAAANLFNTALKTPRPVSKGMNELTLSDEEKPKLQAYIALYQKPKDEVMKAKTLGTLPPEMQESADNYEFIYQWEYYNGNLSKKFIEDYLKKQPNSPFRKLICGEDGKGCITDSDGGIKVKSKVFRGSFGVGAATMGALDLLGLNGTLGLRVNGCEELINLHVGLQYSYYMGSYYDDSDGSKKPESDKTWDVSANQLSLPVTLQLNLYRSKTTSPWAVFAAATGQFNYNLNGKVFGETNKDFVNRTGISTLFSIGFTSNLLSFNLYCRQNFNDLFNRENIFQFDNQNTHNDYDALGKIFENKLLFGAGLTIHF